MAVVGIGGYLWLDEPDRLAFRYVSSNSLAILEPQPAQISPADEGVVITNPARDFYLGAAFSKAAIWANGKPFKSGAGAAWEMVKSAWRLWLLMATASILSLLIKRWRSGLKTGTEKRQTPG